MIGRRSAFTLVAAMLMLVAATELVESPVFGREVPSRRSTVRRLFMAWVAGDRAAFQAQFKPLTVDGEEVGSDRFKIFDETDVYGDLLIGAPGSRMSIENFLTFGNSELVTIFLRWDKAARDDGRWTPLASLFNVSFSKTGLQDSDKIMTLAPVAAYALDLVDG